MGVVRWLKRLFGLAGPAEGGRGDSRSAAAVMQAVTQLQRANAQWPEIWQAINPDGDAETQQLLIDFRGPYMFAPHTALNVLAIGCQRALASSPHADRKAAIRAAMQADDQIIRPN